MSKLNTMNSHDARRRARIHSMLCVVAASLGTNDAVVDAFCVAPHAPSASSKSRSALDISSTIPYGVPTQPSLVDRMFDDVMVAFQPPKKSKKKSVETNTYLAPAAPPRTAPDNVLQLDEQEVRKRKLEWAGRYTTLEALRETFGANENKLWGDLQASTARRLYKTLLPRSLLELSQLGVGELQPQDLAPLAYQARVAAKLYARERCTVPARIAATVFDGFRQWMKYGTFQAHGMTYDQLWQKYAEKICQETENPHVEDVCLKILERSCVSNEGVDNLVLKGRSDMELHQQRLLEQIHSRLEEDMYELLVPRKPAASSDSGTARLPQRRRPWSHRNHVMMVRLLARQKRMMQRRAQQTVDDLDELKP